MCKINYYCFCVGWPDTTDSKGLTRAISESISPEVRVISIHKEYVSISFKFASANKLSHLKMKIGLIISVLCVSVNCTLNYEKNFYVSRNNYSLVSFESYPTTFWGFWKILSIFFMNFKETILWELQLFSTDSQ